jgi:DNA-directed RNA polymerase subunit RPC12/RpoP
MRKYSDYIEFYCPHCGSKIFLYINNDNIISEIFKEIYNCTNCGNNLNIEYNTVLAKLNIKTGICLKK